MFNFESIRNFSAVHIHASNQFTKGIQVSIVIIPQCITLCEEIGTYTKSGAAVTMFIVDTPSDRFYLLTALVFLLDIV